MRTNHLPFTIIGFPRHDLLNGKAVDAVIVIGLDTVT